MLSGWGGKQLTHTGRKAGLAEFNRLSETAVEGWPAAPVHTNRGHVLERAALQLQILPADGRREVEPAVVVGQLHLGHAIAAQIDLEAERIPASLVRVLEVGSDWQHSAGPDKKRQRLKFCVVGDPTCPDEELVGPEVVPSAGR